MDGLRILNTKTICDISEKLVDNELVEDIIKAVVNVVINEIDVKYSTSGDTSSGDVTYIAYGKLKECDKEEIKRRLMTFLFVVLSETSAHNIAITEGLKHNFKTTGNPESDLEEIYSRIAKTTDARNVLRILNLINELESKKDDNEKELIVIAEILQALVSYIFHKIKSH